MVINADVTKQNAVTRCTEIYDEDGYLVSLEGMEADWAAANGGKICSKGMKALIAEGLDPELLEEIRAGVDDICKEQQKEYDAYDECIKRNSTKSSTLRNLKHNEVMCGYTLPDDCAECDFTSLQAQDKKLQGYFLLWNTMQHIIGSNCFKGEYVPLITDTPDQPVPPSNQWNG